MPTPVGEPVGSTGDGPDGRSPVRVTPAVHASEANASIVKAKAAELGFGPVGIAATEPFDADLERTLAWIGKGMQAGMAWLTPERTVRACRPDDLLPGSRALIVVGVPYGGRDPEPADDRARGHVARYARGQDYHDVVKARLDDLAAFVRGLPISSGTGDADNEHRDVPPDAHRDEIRTRVFVDSSPLPERAAAVRAGLGFVGKNTNLLTAQAGSWLLLGALLTTLPLAPDPPLQRDCGRCRLCLDACPTDALPEPFVLDANRCISYLTIEHRGTIPRELRPLIGQQVFGCDICQEVCPWNRRDRGPGWPEVSGPVGADSTDAALPPLGDLLSLDDAAFRDRFRRTPIWRTKRRGLLRNAAVALGNVGVERDLPALTAALRDSEPLVRAHAAWAIGRIGAAAGKPILETARATESDPDVIEELDLAVAALKGDADA